MYRSERWAEEESSPPPPPPPPLPPPRSRSSSRRSSASLSRRSSLKKEKEKEKESAAGSAPASASSTPKKTVKPHNLEFLVTGKQITKRSDRANSLPGSYHRRPSVDVAPRSRKLSEVLRRAPPALPAHPAPPSPRTPAHHDHDTTLEEDMSLDLSQVSDFEDMYSKYGIRNKFTTSTPLPVTPAPTPAGGAGAGARGKARSASLAHHAAPRPPPRSREHSLASSRDSSVFLTETSSPYRGGPELESSLSSQSEAELSQQALSPRTQDLQLSSCCVSTWAESSEAGGAGGGGAGGADGEWCSFWANYNNSLPSAPVKGYYDRCPTPYRTDTADLADWEFSDGSRKRSPENVEVMNNIIRTQGLQLTARETQNIIKCAHLLGSVLSAAIERAKVAPRAPPAPAAPVAPAAPLAPDPLAKKKALTLELQETSAPLPAPPRRECATTQTDISLPNTRSAPRIFENILRQLSRSSIDVDKDKSVPAEVKSESGDVKSESKDVKSETKDVKSEPKDAPVNVTL